MEINSLAGKENQTETWVLGGTCECVQAVPYGFVCSANINGPLSQRVEHKRELGIDNSHSQLHQASICSAAESVITNSTSEGCSPEAEIIEAEPLRANKRQRVNHTVSTLVSTYL